jgi:hypothetical protein
MKKIIDEYIRLNREYFGNVDRTALKEMRPLEEALELAFDYDIIDLISSLARHCEYQKKDNAKVYECLAVMGYEI